MRDHSGAWLRGSIRVVVALAGLTLGVTLELTRDFVDTLFSSNV